MWNPILEKAANHLRNRGHQVDVSDDGQEILTLVEQKEPNVMVLSSDLRRIFGYEIIDKFRTLYPTMKTQFVWITTLQADSGNPAFGWEYKEVSAYLDFFLTEWQVVLTVEQLIYRKVTLLDE